VPETKVQIVFNNAMSTPTVEPEFWHRRNIAHCKASLIGTT